MSQTRAATDIDLDQPPAIAYVLAISQRNVQTVFANRAMRRIAVATIVLTCLTLPCRALVSTNVPLDHWSYDAVDKLANYGLIDSAMLTTKPITRVEMARHVAQAMLSSKRLDQQPRVLTSIIERLKDEFKGELILLGVLDGVYGGSFVKPIENPYAKYLYAQNRPDLENRRGDVFAHGSNYRAGFAARANVFDRVAFYLHPEYSGASSGSESKVDLVEGYGKVAAGPLEIEAGKDSLWWGPGYHGSILMSNNVEPFRMIKVTTPQPVQLPWIFQRLGPFRAEWFLAQLEEDRSIPHAKLSGIRVNLKPHPLLEFGLSRVVMFGGRGVPDVDAFDYAKMFFALSEQAQDNQLAGLDFSVLVPLGELPRGDRLPLRSVRFYLDAAGEDEGGGVPSNWGFLYGLQLNDLFKTGRTDLRVEYADNHVPGKPNVFYEHSLYMSGYTYKNRVIGHHMGTDSRDIFVRLSHYLRDDLIVNLAYDRQIHDLSAATHPVVNIIECDVTFFRWPSWQIEGGYRYEDTSNLGDGDNHIFEMQVIRRF
jgi:hypothetical protein